MRKLFFLFFALVATTSLWAHNFEVGGIYYNYLDGNNVEVTYRGDSYESYKNEYSGEVTIPETVTYDGTTYNVASIGDSTFVECTSLTSVTIPNSVTSIGNYAFYHSSLTSITIPNSVTSIGDLAFSYTSLTYPVYNAHCFAYLPMSFKGAYAIPEGIKYITGGAFCDRHYLTSITIPNSVTSIGNWAFAGSALTSIFIPNSVTSIGEAAFAGSTLTSVTLPNSITNIGNKTFESCDSLTSIIIPNSVTSIGEWAFYSCSSLTSITIPNSVTSIGDFAFAYCSSLTSVTIGNSVTSIGGWAFANCSSLTKTNYTGDIAGWCAIKFGNSYANPMCCSHNFFINDQEIKDLVIPNSVTSIGVVAFSECSSLTSVSIGNSVTNIGNSAFADCSSLTSVTIPNSVTSIGEWAFGDCSSLTSVVWNAKNCADCSYDSPFIGCSQLTSFTFGENVKYIPACLCRACKSLTSITISNSVTSIGDVAFADCSSLPSITIPNSVTSIGEWAFNGCSSLTSITIPNSVTSIGDGAFASCSSLVSMVVESGNTKYDSRDNCNAIIETATNILIASCQNTIIPNSVTSIGDFAFAYCSSLATITIPNSVTSIGDAAFASCSSLTSVTIGNSVTSIGGWAFSWCSSLTSVTIGNSVTSIGDGAFYDCSSLDTLTCLAMTPPALGREVFYRCDNPTLFVPCAALSDYQRHELWRRQFTTIECISSEEAETEEVVIESGTTTIIITWPTEEGADTYTIVIKKDGEVVCTLTFNSEGQLISIAFAPGRNGNHPVQYAEAVANGGYRFTVTGLTESTDYTYNITVKDASNKTIKSHSGKFTTESLTAVENTHSQSPITNCQKILRDGQLLILRDGVEYNAMGQEL